MCYHYLRSTEVCLPPPFSRPACLEIEKDVFDVFLKEREGAIFGLVSDPKKSHFPAFEVDDESKINQFFVNNRLF